MMEAWVVGTDNPQIAETIAVVGELGYTPRRLINYRSGRPEFADGGAPRRPDVVVAIAAAEDHGATEVCRLLAMQKDLAAPVVVSVAETHLNSLPESLMEHELLVRPLIAAELGARIRRARARASGLGADVFHTGTMTVNLASYSVTVDDRPVDCSKLEYLLLKYLITHPRRVLSREALLYGVWGYQYYGGARTVDVHIRRLRVKLGTNAERIKTVRGMGYRFEPV
jgi:DNA-binding response OmpR family regulator